MMIKDLVIRSIEEKDLGQVVGIQESIIQRKVADNWINLVKRQVNKPESVSLVAEHNREVIGFFFGQIKHGDFGLEHSGWIEMFGVSPKAMGEGVGRSLAAAAFDFFRQQGIKDIYTAVRWDSGDLLAFFKSLGFSLSNFINLKHRLD
jgi:ribosomal protein S18 acetylase RimI-like enzyme